MNANHRFHIFQLSLLLLTAAVAAPAARAQLFKKGPKGKSRKEKAVAAEKQQARKRPRASCIWKLSDKDSTIYLAGSVHLLREKDYPVPPAYRAAYNDCTHVVFEADMKTMKDTNKLKEIWALGKYPDGDTLENHVEKKTWRLLKKYIKNRHVGN